MEANTDPAGTYSACRFRIKATKTFEKYGGVQKKKEELWVELAIGSIKEVIDASLQLGTTTFTHSATIEATAVQ